MIPDHMKYVYDRYISSQRWRDKRERALESAHYKERYWCQDCGWDFPKDQLEVHHLTYERLGREKDSDLIVVCSRCHQKQDKLRAKRGREKSSSALYEAQLDGWATAVYGEEWYCDHDPAIIDKEFRNWLWEIGES